MSAAWHIENNTFTHASLPDMIPELVQPYPPGVWSISKGRFKHPLLPSAAMAGAFLECASLCRVSIPHTAESIGDHAFADTALSKVRIPVDCVYSDTSFPEECTIEFYS